MTPALVVAVLLAGGLAALARYTVAVLFGRRVVRFPWAVLVVNVVGCAVAGVVLGLGSGLGDDIRLLMLTGVAGGLTTFSTFSVETLQLVLGGRWRVAVVNVGGNLLAGIGALVVSYGVVVWVVG